MSNRKGCVASWKMRRTGAAVGSAHKMGAAVLRVTQHLAKTPESNTRRTDVKAISDPRGAYNAERASVRTAPERSRIDSRFCSGGDLHGLEERPRGFRGLLVAEWWSAPSLGWACRDARLKIILVRPCITRSKNLKGGSNEKNQSSASLCGLTSSSELPQLRDFLTLTFSARIGKEASSKYEGVCLTGANTNHQSRGRGAPALA
jgi:hypothetical protein